MVVPEKKVLGGGRNVHHIFYCRGTVIQNLNTVVGVPFISISSGGGGVHKLHSLGGGGSSIDTCQLF